MNKRSSASVAALLAMPSLAQAQISAPTAAVDLRQPAFDVAGAKAMLADGLFTRFPKPDYAFAAHVGPAAFDTVSIKDGVESSNSDSVDIVFNGRGAHGSMPDKGIDPITASVKNDSTLAARASVVLTAALGDAVTFIPSTIPGFTASDDFSELADAGVPAMYFGIGGDDPRMLAQYKAQEKPVPVNHSPYFAPVPEPTIRKGVIVLTLAVLMVSAGAR